MTPFEFVFALVSVLTSLAVTHIVSGVVGLIRLRRRVSPVHAMWVLVTFLVVLGNWAALWNLHEQTIWPAGAIAALIVTVIALYAWAALVIPSDVGDVGPDHHDRMGRTYMAAHLVFTLIILGNAMVSFPSIGQALAARIPALMALVVTILALLVRNHRVQFFAATTMVVLATLFAWMTLDIRS